MNNNLTPIDMSKINMPDLSQVAYNALQPSIDAIANQQREIERHVQAAQHEEARKRADEAAYRRETIRSLQAIEQNTANLYTLVDLISKNNDQQEEMIAIISEALTIASAKNKKEAEATYVKVMKRITDTVKCVESMQKLTSWANTIWQAAQPYIEALPFDKIGTLPS